MIVNRCLWFYKRYYCGAQSANNGYNKKDIGGIASVVYDFSKYRLPDSCKYIGEHIHHPNAGTD